MKFHKVLFFCFILTTLGCFFRKKEYLLFVTIQNGCKADKTSRVIWEGKEIGSVDKVTSLGENKVILTLSIQEKAKIPASVNAQCREDLLGDIVIDLSSPANANTNDPVYLQPLDTLRGKYLDLSRVLDSNEKKRLLNKLAELKNTADSIIRDVDSTGK